MLSRLAVSSCCISARKAQSITQCAARGARTSAFGRTTQRKSLKEMLSAPSQGGALSAGRGAIAGASALGLGALCFYGLGFGSEAGAIDRSMVWPEYVKDRVKTTYMYFGSSLGICAGSAVAAFRSPVLMNFMTKNSLLAIGATMAAMIGSGMLVRSIPYKEGLGVKQLAWAGHAALLGVVVAPILILGGPILTKAAWYTAGIVGGLSTVAACAPSEKFLNMGGPLAIGFGVVLASSIGSAFLPPTTMAGSALMSIALYGGLVLFSGFMLYETQHIIKAAETHPQYSYMGQVPPYDPVNMSIGIFVTTLNLFIRIAQMLAMGGGMKRK